MASMPSDKLVANRSPFTNPACASMALPSWRETSWEAALAATNGSCSIATNGFACAFWTAWAVVASDTADSRFSLEMTMPDRLARRLASLILMS